MTPEESNAKLRRLVPWLAAGILGALLGGVVLAFASGREGPWLFVAVDAACTLVLLAALWGALARRR
jgi:uncharacterized membrane protein YfcA